MSAVVLDTRLDARTLLEASAGTGKTYALAGLFVRAVIAQRLAVPQVLAVTYTVAATAELRERVRRRLEQARDLAVAWRDGDPAECVDDSAETALLRGLLHAALHADGGESLPVLRLRLGRAVRDLDLAAISTIHGFCQRVLAEHALDAAQAFGGEAIETNAAPARRRLAVELWRAQSADADGAGFLRRRFERIDGKRGLADALRDLLAPEPLLPPAPPMPADPRALITERWRAVRQAFDADGAGVRTRLLDAIAAKVLNNGQYKAAHVDALWAWCAAHAADAPPSAMHEKLAKYLPDALLAGTSKAGTGRTPQAPLFAAFAAYAEALPALAQWRDTDDLRRLHALRDDARRRDAARKQAFALRDYDDLIAAVHAAATDPVAGPRLAAALRARHPLVLVDEFQDTDARQWAIFAALFGSGGLVLVGDPKQAIYRFRGGDVHTYLAARASADETQSLARNFRSRPCVLAAVDALFAAAPAHALGNGIRFEHVEPGGRARDDDLRHHQRAAPPLTLHVLPPKPASGGDWNQDESIELAARLCAQAVVARLTPGGGWQRRDGDHVRVLQPRDCAVLVRTHREAGAVRRALARVGVPAVASGKQSLFASDEAQDVLALLLALRASGDERRLRAALASALLGLDAAAIVALDHDGAARLAWQQHFDAWRARWERHGPQALLAEVVAVQAPRVLAQDGGERRIANWLQLGEHLQEAVAQAPGVQGQLDGLRQAIADADADDEAQQPRLESDAGRVQILTLHKSKGLEFPLVFLPFAGIGRRDAKPKTVALYPHGGQRVRQWRTEYAHPGAPAWDDGSTDSAVARHVAEEKAEDMRLLYVGLTRARDALWVCIGALAHIGNTALHVLLGGAEPAPALRDKLEGLVESSAGLPDDAPARLPASPAPPLPPAREATRRLARDWWMHSFSQLHAHGQHGAHALADEAPADDEAPVVLAAEFDPRFVGVRFGNALHHALEHVDFAAWRDRDGAPDTAQREVLVAALREHGYREADLDAGTRALAPLVARTLNAAMPEGVRLCDLAAGERIAELEFHFGLRGSASADLLALLQAHGLLRGRRDFGGWTQLSGLMTGKIDLTYRHDGRVYVLDYKSNTLPRYDDAAMAACMADSEYQLQALLYAVAVHRWLRARLGARYDFDAHFGGARYVFARGLDPADPRLGVFAPALPRALVEATDALLAAPMPGTEGDA